MWTGIACGLTACALWGLTYLLPIWLPTYSTLDIALGRALIMGVTALFALWLHRKWVKETKRGDWLCATRLSVIGNVIQPWLLFTSVDYAGVPLAATFFGIIPVLIAVIANERDRRKGKLYVPLKNLSLPLALLFCGLLLANSEGLIDSFSNPVDGYKFEIGCLFAIGSTAAWTWYPIRNADWLLEHPKVSPLFFAEMQSVVLLPVSFLAYAAIFIFGNGHDFLGSSPLEFCALMFMAGFFCSFIAAALWNAMSQNVPTAVVGPMLVFETIFSVTFSLIYAATVPSIPLLVGMALLVIGVIYTLVLFNRYSIRQMPM